MRPAGDRARAPSLQTVSDEEFERPVEANMRQGGCAVLCHLERGRTEANKLQIGRSWYASREQRGGVVGKIARKNSSLGSAVETLAFDVLASFREAENRGQPFTAALHQGFARGANGREGDHVDPRAGEFCSLDRAVGE